MSLIGTGQGLRRKAQQGMEAVARLENQRNMQQSALDAQAKAQEMQMYGTGMGIGGAYGVNKALAAKGATEVTAGSAKLGALSNPAAQTKTASLLQSAVPGASGAPTTAMSLAPQQSATALLNQASVAGGGQVAAGGSAVGAGTTGGTVVGAGAGGGTVAGAGAGAGAAGGAAAGSSGALATLGTIAAPLAIGLGAAFLLNKLFG